MAAPDRPSRVQRLLAIALGLAVFIGTASLLSPMRSSARAKTPPAPAASKAGTGAQKHATRSQADADAAAGRTTPPVRNSRGQALLGEMIGANNVIWIYGTATGAVYTVCDVHGMVLRENLAADEVYREFPDLDIAKMHLEPTGRSKTGALMMADPDKVK